MGANTISEINKLHVTKGEDVAKSDSAETRAVCGSCCVGIYTYVYRWRYCTDTDFNQFIIQSVEAVSTVRACKPVTQS